MYLEPLVYSFNVINVSFFEVQVSFIKIFNELEPQYLGFHGSY